MRVIGSLTQIAKFSLFGFILGILISCASKSLSSKDSNEAIYFVGLNGVSFSLKSDDNFKTATMKDSSGMSYALLGVNKDCMQGDGAKVCFDSKYARVDFGDGRAFKVVPIPKVKL
ncbi:hypothetical protein [Campylobacter corcagiensis]|uniref:Lipoprotein n=1 Tax=Campylobacter corcagiensis TaxID=1448857 RepID=A0A7M1LJF0_9BACT|nr:hypothetical protein [Campylobacter corcagiensis]QOQ88044.1 hypothetical protein IMC76_04435 [Campylobacter corcagiensis]